MGTGSGNGGGGSGYGRLSGPPTRSKSGLTQAQAQSQANVGFGTETISTQKAKAQLSAKQSEFGKSVFGKVPGMAMVMGNASLMAQQTALDEGGIAVAVPGTSFAPQGQAYTEAPGMKSSAALASQGLAVGSGFGKNISGKPTGSIGKYSASKPGQGSGQGYVGDVAGVVNTTEVFGVPVTTFTGKTGYGPTGQKVDEVQRSDARTSSPPVASAPVVETTTPSAQLSSAAKARIASGGSGTDRRLFIV
jgi:hypothetical protein